MAGDVQYTADLHRYLGHDVKMQKWRLRIHCKLAIELVIGVLLHLLGRLTPDRRALVDYPVCHIDGERDIVGVRPHDLLQPPRGSELLRIVLELDLDRGSALLLLRRFQAIGAVASRDPGPGLRLRTIGAGRHPDLVGHHKNGVEPHTELPDDVVNPPPLFQGLQERSDPRVRDGTQVLDKLLARHADAGIRDGKGMGVFVALNTDRQLHIWIQHVLVGQHHELHTMQCIGSVGDQLS